MGTCGRGRRSWPPPPSERPRRSVGVGGTACPGPALRVAAAGAARMSVRVGQVPQSGSPRRRCRTAAPAGTPAVPRSTPAAAGGRGSEVPSSMGKGGSSRCTASTGMSRGRWGRGRPYAYGDVAQTSANSRRSMASLPAVSQYRRRPHHPGPGRRWPARRWSLGHHVDPGLGGSGQHRDLPQDHRADRLGQAPARPAIRPLIESPTTTGGPDDGAGHARPRVICSTLALESR